MGSTESDSMVGGAATRRWHLGVVISSRLGDERLAGFAPPVPGALDRIQSPQSRGVQHPTEFAVGDASPDDRSRVGRGVVLLPQPKASGQQRTFLGADPLSPQPAPEISDVQIPGNLGFGVRGCGLGVGAGAVPIFGFRGDHGCLSGVELRNAEMGEDTHDLGQRRCTQR